MKKKLHQALNFLHSKWGTAPSVAIVLGSGLGGNFIKKVSVLDFLKYSQVPHFLSSDVTGHPGQMLTFALSADSKSYGVILHGRLHLYEGLEPSEVVFPIRVLALWGVKKIILTNASGALHAKYRVGDVVLVKDHINLTGLSPLKGPNLDILGPRFPAMGACYQNALSRSLQQLAKKNKISLKEAIYVGVTGPQYETEAEVRAFCKLGGDLVGMSTVLEAIAATHAGMEVALLSVVTNGSFGRTKPLTHEEVLLNASRSDKKLAKLLLGYIDGFKEVT